MNTTRTAGTDTQRRTGTARVTFTVEYEIDLTNPLGYDVASLEEALEADRRFYDGSRPHHSPGSGLRSFIHDIDFDVVGSTWELVSR